MTYNEVIEFIKETEKLGSVLGLTNIRNLLNRLGNPQDRLKIIHVAGTNGKGSTIAFLSSILAAEGYRVGIYISPVVFSYHEKLQIISMDSRKDDILNKSYINNEDICKAIDLIKAACEDMVKDGQVHPTSFEIETAMAFLYMDWQEVDFLILETGMGGRMDATNVISSPICSVFTSVSIDHMQFLGSNLREIAVEKAGIMKANSFVVTCNQQEEVLSVFESRAKKLNIPIFTADITKAENINYNKNYTEFDYKSPEGTYTYRINLLGKYQITNAILAIETARCLTKVGFMVGENAIKKGLFLAKWQGRFEQISTNPHIYIDGGHNEEAALSLRDSIEIYFANKRLIFLIGVLADKDYHKMLSILAPLADTIITLTPNNQRALASYILAKEARVYCKKVIDGGDLEHSMAIAYEEAGSDDVILAFGSLSFLGSLVKLVSSRKYY